MINIAYRPVKAIAAALIATTCLLPASPLAAQEAAPEKIDLTVLHDIKTQAFQHSQVMDHLFYISEVYGPRITSSPNHRAAAEWIVKRLQSYGLQNVHLEPWGPFGNSWQYKKFYGALVEPNYAPLIGFPLAWTPGTDGPVTAEAVLAPIHTQADFEKYRGKLKGKIVLIADPKVILMHTEPEAHRLTDEEIEARTIVSDPSRLGPGGGGAARGRGAAAAPAPPVVDRTAALRLRNDTSKFLSDEGVLVAVNYGTNGDGGTVFASFGGSQDPNDPVPPPMVAITPEHYNRIARLIEHHMSPKVTFDIQAETYKTDQMGFNVVGEIPGTTKKDEVVMLGGHLDSWQGGTGATDNGTGSSVAIEAVRILTQLHRPMARTVRIALWGGEEEGLLGSKFYVQHHFAPRDTMKLTPEYAKLDAYFNDDSGSGRFRGISSDGNDEIAAIFKQWAAPIRDLEFQAVTGATAAPTREPGGTDSTSFSWIGLDGFGFMQDPLEYAARTHHSNMDLYDRVQVGDVMQGAAIEAWFVYNAATRPSMLPRLDTPTAAPASSTGN
ncbi:M28 family peptidase [Granulicella sp. L60]|jgi:carboxypeptidase Q|uniref:M28 family peptidase n=1 Tax=Granulicella sp. L60 TaxID=1641866 RepID=UPI0020B13491|nr:M28 family peptidase [Granulicella sp. L60]